MEPYPVTLLPAAPVQSYSHPYCSTCVPVRTQPLMSNTGDSAVTHRTGKLSLEARLAEKREKATAHVRKRDIVAGALGRVFGSFW
jgi:hypothetical protein